MLDKIKLLLGITDANKDDLLLELISEATAEAKAYTHRDDVEILQGVIVQMVVYRYQTLGTEGLTSENYSGVAFNYSTSYPSNIIKMLNSCRKVVWK